MSVFQGSLNHTPSGRRKRKTYTNKKKQNVKAFKTYTKSLQYIRDSVSYPSRTNTSVPVKVDRSVEIEISSNYTIAPAYNKGAYQVISSANVRDIGK